jgi:cytochrome c oxidase cbb3-type subunit 3
MRKLIPSYVRIPAIFFAVFGAMEYFIESEKPAFIEFPMVSVFLIVFLFFLIAIEVVMNTADSITYHMLTDEQKKKLEEIQSIPFTESAFYQGLMKKFTNSKDIEHEDEIILDHDYDGIKELDNVLPPWWVYLFYATIIFSVVYLVRFHIMNEYDQDKEFRMEMADAQKQIDTYKLTAPDLMSVDKVVLLTDAADIAKGKVLYEAHCIACHKADGGGSIGPNLTDEHWILGGGIKNVFNTLMEGGRDGKGMVSWKNTVKPSDLQKVASYVLTLQGTNPKDAKVAEGEVWVDETAANPDVANVAKPADTVTIKK